MYVDHQSFESKQFDLYWAWCLARISSESYRRGAKRLPSVFDDFHFCQRFFDLDIPLDQGGLLSSHLRGFLASYHFSKKSAVILIAFRGTHDVAGLLTDLKFPATSIENWGFKCKVHGGFKFSAESFLNWAYSTELWGEDHVNGAFTLERLVHENLTGLRNDRFVLTGHSLGGALATCVSSLLVSQYLRAPYNGEPNLDQLDVTSYTFGAPPVGNKSFISQLGDSFTQHRVEHINDKVTSPPIYSKLFSHYGKAYVLKDHVNYWSHRMFNYVNILASHGEFRPVEIQDYV